ncbi:MAG: DUF262 domain-containing protein [Candidatus Aminicenantes bacterium]|nr:DUF262 domain-containing protein [Candidatus Aminicenantes bacterium]
MKITPTNYTVADYCQAMTRKEIIVNRDYQRSDKVWPPAARSFFIESILLEYPIPKLSLYQVTDVRSKKTHKEIVDGQQRSQTIFDFFKNKLRLSKACEIEEAAGKLYSELDEKYQHAFLDYSISVDLFVSATPKEIRETFRRINSYTVPLNPEEKRHSIYQGDFKWYIYNLSKRYDQSLLNIGVFPEKRLIRMADAKLFSEIIHTLLNGFTTSVSTLLDNLYKKYDSSFPDEKAIDYRINQAMDIIFDLEEIHKGPLMKPFNIYTLILAIIHSKKPVEKITSIYKPKEDYMYDRNVVISNLTSLADSLEYPDKPSQKFKEFVQANLSKTNGAPARKIRFKFFCRALEPNLI